MFTGSLIRLWADYRSYAPWATKTHSPVLWGSKYGNQFGSPQDLHQAKLNARIAKAYRSFAKMLRRNQLAISRIGVSAQDALGNLRSINDYLNREQRRRASSQ